MTPLATWDTTTRAVVLDVPVTLTLQPSEARALVQDVERALQEDTDSTPRTGTYIRPGKASLKAAYKRFYGDLVHAPWCAAHQAQATLEARIASRACSCGLRDLVLALEEVCG